MVRLVKWCVVVLYDMVKVLCRFLIDSFWVFFVVIKNLMVFVFGSRSVFVR